VAVGEEPADSLILLLPKKLSHELVRWLVASTDRFMRKTPGTRSTLADIKNHDYSQTGHQLRRSGIGYTHERKAAHRAY
jgi:hypothetical protein